ncbi:MAG: hypothetical protein UU08_C0002G0007 [Candidatus Uhrbacteria bacterium GW2011_GWE2_40_58]|nr:MAG: hypothetical protein UU08_C0002G0007 [Candidatus Uhrbacteria bacterium GW2011_GWE2_40_58]
MIAQIKKIKTNTRIKVKRTDANGNYVRDTNGQIIEDDDFMGAWEAIQKGQGGAKKKNIAEQTEAVMANTGEQRKRILLNKPKRSWLTRL